MGALHRNVKREAPILLLMCGGGGVGHEVGVGVDMEYVDCYDWQAKIMAFCRHEARCIFLEARNVGEQEASVARR